jgi:hypothetical protein
MECDWSSDVCSSDLFSNFFEFIFNNYQMSSSTNYFVSIERDGTWTGDVNNRLDVGVDTTSPTHAGIRASITSSWASTTDHDLIFEVYSGSLGAPLLDKTSNTDSGFDNITTPADTDPFNSGDRVGYTVQSGDALDDGTYYWRVRGLDPSGSNTYGAWSSTRSFEVTGGATPNSGFFTLMRF